MDTDENIREGLSEKSKLLYSSDVGQEHLKYADSQMSYSGTYGLTYEIKIH